MGGVSFAGPPGRPMPLPNFDAVPPVRQRGGGEVEPAGA